MDEVPAYLRRSQATDTEGSIATSRADVRSLAARLGAAVPDELLFVDDDVSASKVRKEDSAWGRLLEYLRGGRPRLVLFAAYDRIGRRLTDLEDLHDMSRALGFEVWTVRDGNFFESAAWPVLAGVAKMEAARTRERVMRAQQERRASGRDGGGGDRPYGYAHDRMTVIPEEADVLREVYRRVLRGETFPSIAADLNTRGVPTARPSKTGWRASVLRETLANPRYAGILVHHGEPLGGAAWEPVFSREEHSKILTALSTTARPVLGPPVRSLLSGKLRCQNPRDTGPCDVLMVAAANRGTPSYRCSRQDGGCGRLTRKRETLERYAVRELLGRADSEILEREGSALEARDRELANADASLDLDIYVLRQRFTAGEIAGRDYYPTLDGLRKRQQKVQDEARRLAARRQAVSREGASDQWDVWNRDQRRAFIDDKIVTILVHPARSRGRGATEIRPGEVEIVWRDGV